MSKAIEQSIKQKLKSISIELKIPFNSLLDTLFLERFLVRISRSKYADKLIFKGGMCLAQIIELGRETRDIDFLIMQVNSNNKTIKVMLEEISNIDIGDSFKFSSVNVGELSIEHKKYPGYRVTVQGTLGQIRNNVSIDIGVGDMVRPKSLLIELMNAKGPLFEETINLKSYPPEYIFSEKLEAILHLGELNSRMKDFYDCFRLIQENVLNIKDLKLAITETFRNRETDFRLIPESTEEFKVKWNSFIKKNSIQLELSEVIREINITLKKL